MFDKNFIDLLAECLYNNLRNKKVTKKRIIEILLGFSKAWIQYIRKNKNGKRLQTRPR